MVQDLARVQVSERLRRPKYFGLVYDASRLDTVTSLEHFKLEEKGIWDTFFEEHPKNSEKKNKNESKI